MNKIGLGLLATAASMVLVPVDAMAQWSRAETPHFVIYSEESQKSLEDFARELELFDGAYRSARGMPDRELAEGNKLRVFVVATVQEVQEAMGGGASGVAGFYRPRLSGSYAVVPRVAGGNDRRGIDPEIIFFHEYTHHLMFETLYSPMPAWLREGFAEFFSTADVNVDKSEVSLGRPAMHRANQLQYLKPMPMEEMLSDDIDYRDYRHVSSIYAWGWVLTHYLTFESDRAGQLDAYIAGIMQGTAPDEAARNAFGDLNQLGGEMRAYRDRNRMPYVKIDVPRLANDAVSIRTLSPGMNQAMDFYMHSQLGVSSGEDAKEVMEGIRSAAQAYPDDAMVHRALAEALYDMRDLEGAKQAAERSLEIDPGMVDAHLYLARIAMAHVDPQDSWDTVKRKVEEAIKKAEAKEKGEEYVEPDDLEEEKPELEESERRAYFAEARQHIEAARALSPKDPEPHYMFYDSFEKEGIEPPIAALQGLLTAIRLAPYDKSARFEGAKALMKHGNSKDAEILLSAIAYDTHGRQQARAARAMIDFIREGDLESAMAVDPEDFEDTDEDEGEDEA